MFSMTVLPRWSAPTALMNETLCPSLLRWAEKLNEAPPKYSSWPTMSQRTSPMLTMFNAILSLFVWPRLVIVWPCACWMKMLAQYTLPRCKRSAGFTPLIRRGVPGTIPLLRVGKVYAADRDILETLPRRQPGPVTNGSSPRWRGLVWRHEIVF